MTSSKKTAYVANGEDLDQPFEDNELLNKKGDYPFDDPPWKVLDTDIGFEPMAIKMGEVTDAGFVAETSESADPSNESNIDASADTDAQDPQSDEDEWAEVGTMEPVVQGVPEEEVAARIEAAVAEAIANTQTTTAEPLNARITELEAALEAAQADIESVRTQTREETEAEYQALLENSRKTYDQLTEKLAHAADNVSEFFEPLSKLATHVGCQLVRGELTVGPTAIARLVQGCLDALEGYQPKNPPVLRMHPEDLATYLSGIDGEPEGVQLRGDETMARGDVSLQMDDTAVDDLIAHRLEKLSNHVFGIGPTLSDAMFRTSFSGESETASAFEDIEEFIDAEVVTSDSSVEASAAQKLNTVEDLVSPASESDAVIDAIVEAEAEAEAEAEEARADQAVAQGTAGDNEGVS